MRSISLIQRLFIVALAMACPALTAEDRAVEPGAKVFQDSCLTCHKGNQSIDQVRLTRAQWKEAVDRMIDSSFVDPVPSKDKLALLLDYLSKNRGPSGAAGPDKK